MSKKIFFSVRPYWVGGGVSRLKKFFKKIFFQKNAFFLFLLKKMKKCVNEPNFLIIVFKNNCFFKKKKKIEKKKFLTRILVPRSWENWFFFENLRKKSSSFLWKKCPAIINFRYVLYATMFKKIKRKKKKKNNFFFKFQHFLAVFFHFL